VFVDTVRPRTCVTGPAGPPNDVAPLANRTAGHDDHHEERAHTIGSARCSPEWSSASRTRTDGLFRRELVMQVAETEYALVARFDVVLALK
jgi:hypothetical protein